MLQLSLKAILFTAAVFFLSLCTSAQITVTTGINAAGLVQQLVGTGVTFTNPTLTCNTRGNAKFSSTNVALGLDSGVILTTGYARSSTNGADTGTNAPQTWLANEDRISNSMDADLFNLAGVTVSEFQDLCKLEFDFVPQGDTLRFQYKFASDEYPQYVCSPYNDIFAFFIQGFPQYGAATNLAVIPNTNIPVAINSINSGTPGNQYTIGACNAMGAGSPYTNLYFNNAGSNTIIYDGTTVLLTATAVVTPCSTYHMKFAIADIIDGQYDSGVFLKAGSFTTNAILIDTVLSPTALPIGWPYSTEGCNSDTIVIRRLSNILQPQTIYINLAGTATNGVDYATIPTSITIPAGDSVGRFWIVPINDFITEGTETVLIGISATSCSSSFADTMSVLLNEFPTYTVTDNDTLCLGQSKIISATTAPANSDLTYTWSPMNITAAAVNVTPFSTQNYTVTAKYPGCPNRDSVVKLNVSGYPTVNAGPDTTICTGTTTQLNGTASAQLQYPVATTVWTPAGTLGNNTALSTSATPAGSTTYTLTATNIAGCVGIDFLTVTVKPLLTLSATSTSVNCANQNGSISSTTNVPLGTTVNYTLLPNNITNTTGNYSNLSGGITYTITATSAGYCNTSTTLVLAGVSPISWGNVSFNSITCNNLNNGSISSLVSGGNGIITYNILPLGLSNNTGVFSGLGANTYTITANDALNCTTSTSITIVNPSALSVAANTSIQNVCFGQSAASINYSVVGGIAPITYSLNGGVPTFSGSYSNLAAGNYTVVARDINNCSLSIVYSIQDPPQLSLNVSNVISTLCIPSNSGSFTANGAGGTGSLAYTSNNGTGIINSGSGNFSNLLSGTYTSTVTDAQGCTSTAITIVSSPPLPSITAISTTSVSCYGASNGAITVTAANGSGTLNISILPLITNNGSGGFSNASAGSYTIMVTDVNSCTTSSVVTIVQPPPIVFGNTTATGTLCNSIANGTITTSATGGTGGIIYTLLNNSVTNATGNFGALIAATYTVQASDGNSCTASTTIAVTQPSSLSWNTITPGNISCHAGNNGNIIVTTNGGTGIKLYSLNGGPGTPASTFTNLTAGNYTIIVTDANNCNLNTVVTLTQPNALSFLSINNTTLSCNPGIDATITALAQGGTGAYVYALNGGTFSSNASWPNNGGGLYSVTVRDGNNCIYSALYSVLAPTTPSITSAVPTAAQCVPLQSGSVLLGIVGNGNALQYSVGGTFGTSSVLQYLASGNYIVTVADAYGCSTSTAVNIPQAPAPIWNSITQINYPSCIPGCDASLQLSYSAANYPVHLTSSNSYSQYSNANMLQANGMCQGPITFYITDTVSGCRDTLSTVVDSSAVLLSASATSITCFGNTDGIITATTSTNSGGTITTVLNGASPQTGTNINFNALAQGSYSLIATNALGCSSQTVATIMQPTQVVFSAVNPTAASCYNGNNGSAAVLATGGTGTYTFTLVGVGIQNTNGTFSNLLAPSNYTIQASDANGCNTNTTLAIASPPTLAGGTVTSDSASCFGLTDGSIALTTFTGGTGAYTYTLSGSGGSNGTGLFTNLANGNYTITVSDGNNCTTTIAAAVASPPQLVLGAPIIQPVSCNGNANGTITIVANGGTPGYTYQLNGGSANSNGVFVGLNGGNFTITATDANGCSTNKIAVVVEPAVLSISSTSQNISCFGTSNGSVSHSTSGGNTTFSFTLLPNNIVNNTGTFNSLGTGIYTVQVVDNNACFATTIFTITQPAPLTIDSVNFSNPSCSGGTNSSVLTYASGGTAPLAYTLLPTALNNASGVFASLPAGNYTVQVQDANSCNQTSAISLTAPTAITIDVVSVQNVQCNGDSSAQITALASGGTGALLYSLSPGNTVNSSGGFSGIPAAFYTLTVSDVNNCSTSTIINITQNTAINFDPIEAENPRCSSGTDGYIIVAAQGGVAPLQYRLNALPAVPNLGNFQNLGLGVYTITAQDAIGCKITTTIILNTPQDLVVTVPNVSTTVCPDKSDASVQVTATFGNPGGYTFSLSPGLQVNNTGLFTNLAAGNYTVQVVDKKGCSGSAILKVTPSTTQIVVELSISPVSCNTLLGNDGAITPLAITGVPPYLYYWPQVNDTLPMLNSLTPGTYYVQTVDADGCTAIDTAVLAAPPCCDVFMPNAFTPDGNGRNDVYRPAGPADINILQFDIFDRWGNLIFSGAKSTKAWDGTRSGNPLDMDTYFYVLRYYCRFDKKEYSKSGDFILTR